jgi:uncharacterized membrane protein (Fun14 family)
MSVAAWMDTRRNIITSHNGKNMESKDIEYLVRDAEDLAQRAAIKGKLPEDCKIFEAISAISEAVKSAQIPDVSQLYLEIDRLTKATKIAVKSATFSNRFLRTVRQCAIFIAPFILGFMTLLLTLYLAYQSSELNKADMALREYQDLQTEHLQEKLYLAWKMYRYEKVLNLTGPPLAQLDGYQKLVEEAKRLTEKREAIANLLTQSSTMNYVPSFFMQSGPDWIKKIAFALNGTSLNSNAALFEIGQAPSLGKASGDTDLSKDDDKTFGDGTDCYRIGEMFEKERLLEANVKLAKVNKINKQHNKSSLSNTDELELYNKSTSCFLKALNIKNQDYPLGQLIYAARMKVNLLVSWLLPALYGLLGACVFLMRDLLIVNGTSKLSSETKIVDLLSLALRLALGGLAGIIIGWFWVPSSTSGTSAPSLNISSIPFGIAFLAGFSIDSVFSLLDRLNKAIDHSGEKTK